MTKFIIACPFGLSIFLRVQNFILIQFLSLIALVFVHFVDISFNLLNLLLSFILYLLFLPFVHGQVLRLEALLIVYQFLLRKLLYRFGHLRGLQSWLICYLVKFQDDPQYSLRLYLWFYLFPQSVHVYYRAILGDVLPHEFESYRNVQFIACP